MSSTRFSIEIKHDTQHRKWRRLSVITLSPKALDGDAYRDQFACDNQMNPDQLAWRILEIDMALVGRDSSTFIRIVEMKESAATENRGLQVNYGYYINLDERGDFQADVRDASGKTVFEFSAGCSLEEDESSLFDDGFMVNKNDIEGLTSYLRDCGFIPQNGVVLKMSEFEALAA